MKIFFLVLILSSVILGILSLILKKINKENSGTKKLVFACLIFASIVFLLFCITPSLVEEYQVASIQYSNDNIMLYNKYVEEYSSAAKLQIEQYQKMQNESLRIATANQLQYWSQQQDNISNALTGRVKEFKDLILKEEMSINKKNSIINFVKSSRWFIRF